MVAPVAVPLAYDQYSPYQQPPMIYQPHMMPVNPVMVPMPNYVQLEKH